MLAATAGVSADLAPATIFDFSFAAAAVKELAADPLFWLLKKFLPQC